MIWPPQQEAALNAVAAWFRRGEPQIFRQDSAVMAIEELVDHLIEAGKRAGSLRRAGRKTLRASPGEELKS
jgi:hypothetical protein